MGAVSDFFGGLKAGFMLATILAGLLFVGTFLNWISDPTRERLQYSDEREYGLHAGREN
jgi:hypothetical protein